LILNFRLKIKDLTPWAVSRDNDELSEQPYAYLVALRAPSSHKIEKADAGKSSASGKKQPIYNPRLVSMAI